MYFQQVIDNRRVSIHVFSLLKMLPDLILIEHHVNLTEKQTYLYPNRKYKYQGICQREEDSYKQ